MAMNRSKRKRMHARMQPASSLSEQLQRRSTSLNWDSSEPAGSPMFGRRRRSRLQSSFDEDVTDEVRGCQMIFIVSVYSIYRLIELG
jgi:hypothetical protein